MSTTTAFASSRLTSVIVLHSRHVHVRDHGLAYTGAYKSRFVVHVE